MIVTVTGSNGFIGEAVCRELKQRGHTVITADLGDGVDILNAEHMNDRVGLSDGVIHLAGVLGTAELFDQADRAVDVNIKGTLRVLDACRINGATYVGITMPNVWLNLYQATKLCAKRIALAYHDNFGIPVRHVKAFNVFGPGQKYGPGHPQKIIPTFASLSWAGKPMPIWGNGQQTVDLIYVDDVARILVDAVESQDDFARPPEFEAGSGKEFTVLEIARFVGRVTGCSTVEFLPMRDGESLNTRIHAENPQAGFDWQDLVETVRSYK